MKLVVLSLYIIITMLSCSEKTIAPLSSDIPFSDYTKTEASLWLDYSPDQTVFKIWSPLASKITIQLYISGDTEPAFKIIEMKPEPDHSWQHIEKGDLNGTYYTYQITTATGSLNETPGIYAKAVGVNGNRAMVLDLDSTNPKGWKNDKRPTLLSPNDAIIYELHVRDITISPASGSSLRGKYLGLVEPATRSNENLSTGIDHLKELGITHVHLLPVFDHYSIDETRLDSAQFNWGYDPQNYNVPEGSYSSDPFDAKVRIVEFKEMVQAFHQAGIGVILDVAYNHTGITENSNFNQEVPGYYYRQNEDGTWSDASACGNETASERPMMRKFIRESVKYWANEYHLDGFRFDLMAIHDIELMNEIANDLKTIDPSIFVYGEGWTAGDSPLPVNDRALKKHGARMPNISVFSDDIRDGLKGSVFDDKDTGFASGKAGMEESVRFGVVGSIQHDQIDYTKVNYSDAPYATNPWESISYISCHDNHTLFDKLTISRPEADRQTIKKMHQLANAVVLTSQGIPFLHAGVEMMRSKGGEHNSYKSSDAVNQIDWVLKEKNNDVVDYHKQLIKLRKEHPAFRIRTGESLRQHLKFLETEPGMVAYTLSGNANGDTWRNILVIYNANPEAKEMILDGQWTLKKLAESQQSIKTNTKSTSTFLIPPIEMLVAYQE